MKLKDFSAAYKRKKSLYRVFLAAVGVLSLLSLLYVLCERALENGVGSSFLTFVLSGFLYLCAVVFLLTMVGGPGGSLVLLWYAIKHTALCLKKQESWAKVVLIVGGLILWGAASLAFILTFHHYTGILNQ